MVFNSLRDIFKSEREFNLQDLEGFPYSEYQDQWDEYTQAERWFTGAALEDQPENTGKADLYPMRINPIFGTVMKHAAILFGEVEDDGRALVVPKLVYDPENEQEKKQAEFAEKILSDLWWENNGRATMIESALMSQIYGGCVLKATYVPWEWDKYGGHRQIPIRIEQINPKNFVGIPDGSDNYNLIDTWIVKEIARQDAVRWGYEGDEDYAWYVEHWTSKKYEITINGKPAYRMVGTEKVSLEDENPFGFIPMMYIPHVRITGFRGINAFSHLVGMVKELNARWGDFGDAVNDDSHPIVAARNIYGSIQLKRVTDWFEYLDLGNNPSISNNDRDPDAFQVNTQRASTAMTEMLEGIMAQYRRDSFVPPVADGEDEGSQRSGLTLSIRFWPLTTHGNIERYFWTPGLDRFHWMLLKIMAIKKIAEITEAHTKMRIRENWAPFLPKDREALVNEWAVRSSNNIASLDHLIELSGDVEDVQLERERILQSIQDIEAAKAKAQVELRKLEIQSQEKLAAEANKNKPSPTSGSEQNDD
jgi:hypothetical protein